MLTHADYNSASWLGNRVSSLVFLFFWPPEDNANLFREEGVANYTTMLLREDLDVLLVGAREEIYALDLKDISKKRASVRAPHIQAVPPLKQNQMVVSIQPFCSFSGAVQHNKG